MSKRVNLGQYFTKSIVWMKPQIIDFIKSSNKTSMIDPFAGNGDLIEASRIIGIDDGIGYDIDSALGWQVNDSLKNLIKLDRIAITNPPYLAKNSAKRKNLQSYSYFKDNKYIDLYQIALEKLLGAYEYVVAIIPETFLLSGLFIERLNSITILEDNPFEDTDCPVCVACFDNINSNIRRINIYKNEEFVLTLGELELIKKIPSNSKNISFNRVDGNIGIRCIDGTDCTKNIKYCKPEELNYQLNKISNSSRSITIANVETDKDINKIIIEANKILDI